MVTSCKDIGALFYFTNRGRGVRLYHCAGLRWCVSLERPHEQVPIGQSERRRRRSHAARMGTVGKPGEWTIEAFVGYLKRKEGCWMATWNELIKKIRVQKDLLHPMGLPVCFLDFMPMLITCEHQRTCNHVLMTYDWYWVLSISSSCCSSITVSRVLVGHAFFGLIFHPRICWILGYLL